MAAVKNQIIFNDVIHEFVVDKPNVDTCYLCSFQQVCYDKMNRDNVCSIFTNKQVDNGHFEIKQ